LGFWRGGHFSWDPRWFCLNFPGLLGYANGVFGVVDAIDCDGSYIYQSMVK